MGNSLTTQVTFEPRAGKREGVHKTMFFRSKTGWNIYRTPNYFEPI